ncbi:MAG: nuclear transport factor 2 family protein [Acidimicrobiaceae bacterium]|nr:nuclear transport factor 2 family protein [Acidimicrobiaceae bacterium]
MDANAIRNLAIRYSLSIDDGRIDDVAALFAPDATFAARYGEPLRGRDAIAAFLAANARGQEASAHSVLGHLIEPDGEGRAVGIVQVGAVLDKDGETLRFSLRCHDRYRLLDGTWLFAHRGIVVRYQETATGDGRGWSLAAAQGAQADDQLDDETRYVLRRIWTSEVSSQLSW